MNLRMCSLGLLLVAALEPAGAENPQQAEDPGPAVSFAADELEPAVDVSAHTPEPATTPPAATESAESAAQREALESGTAQTHGGSLARSGAAMDRLDLDSTVITGSQELPKVLYIVPWKKSELGELPGRPVNSLVNEVLSPVDRDSFRRRIDYYDALFGTQVTDPPRADE